jgi:hypothetical protein
MLVGDTDKASSGQPWYTVNIARYVATVRRHFGLKIEKLGNGITRRTIFWDVTGCRLVEADRCFRGTHSLCHQSRGVRQASKQKADPKNWGSTCLRNVDKLHRLHNATSPNIVLFIVTAVIASNSIQFNTYLFTCKLNSPEANYIVSTRYKRWRSHDGGKWHSVW